MDQETKDLVTDPNLSAEAALLDELAAEEPVTGTKQENGNAEANRSETEQEESAADEASPDPDSPEALRAKLTELERRATDAEKRAKAAQAKMFEALTKAKRTNGDPKAEPKRNDSSGDVEEGDESDEIDIIYEKHLKKLSDKFPDETDSKLRARASKLAWKEYFESLADRKAKALIEEAPATQMHKEAVAAEKARGVTEFVMSKPELKNSGSEVYKLTDQIYAEKLRLIGAADGIEYIRFNPDKTVSLTPEAHLNLDTRDILESAYYEAVGRLGGTSQRGQAKKPSVAKGSSSSDGKQEKFKDEGEFLDWLAG